MKALKVLFLSQQDIVNAGGMDMRATIDDVSMAFSLFDRKDCVLPTKTSLRWGDDQSEIETGRINSMPGYLGGSLRIAGLKWIGGSPANPFRHGIPRASGILVLNDPETMLPVVIMEGALISAMRTGAVTGVGARYLARANSRVAGLIGAGVQGRTQLMALKQAIPSLREARVFDRDKPRRDSFSREMSEELEMTVNPVECYRECVEGCDVFVTAIVTNVPVVKNEWVSNGSFYAHVGSYECEFEVVSCSDKVVVDSWEAVAHRDVTTISKMLTTGVFSKEQLHAEMGEIVNGSRPGREKEDERIMFAPIGFCLHDLAVGSRIYKNARELKLGQELVMYDQPMWS